MNKTAVIGVDLGGTKVSIGLINDKHITQTITRPISAQKSEQIVIEEIKHAVNEVFNGDVEGIGIGVPSLVNVEKGIVYNVHNIPSWKEIHLKSIMEDKFGVPVYINNDANCFAVGEKFFGKGLPYKNLAGVTLGTGLGAGIIINNHLYSGINCGAGEFGHIHYKEHTVEHYCSGQFFMNHYQSCGKDLFIKAKAGDKAALQAFEVFGMHIGQAVMTIMYAFDPEAIIFGGSVSDAFDLFKSSMWDVVNTFPYKNSIKNLVIEKSEQKDIAVLGAAALYYDACGEK